MASRAATNTRPWRPSLKAVAIRTVRDWSEDKVPRISAAFSFYAILSLAPMLILAIVAAGYFFDRSAVRDSLLHEVQNAVGSQGRDLVMSIIEKTYKPGASSIATVFSLIVAFFGASSLFMQLDESMNMIWEIQAPVGQPFWKSLILQRIPSVIAVLGFGLATILW